MKGLKLGPAAGIGALLTGLAWGQGRSQSQLSLRTAKKSCPSARVPGWDWWSLLLLSRDGEAMTAFGRGPECCLDSGDWEGRSGTLWESYRVHQVSKLGGVTNPASKTSPLDGLSDRILGLDGITVRNLNYSTLCLLIPKSSVWTAHRENVPLIWMTLPKSLWECESLYSHGKVYSKALPFLIQLL